MYKLLYIVLLSLTPILSNAQSEKFTSNNHDFEIKIQFLKNDWGTTDTLQTLYRIEENHSQYLLKFYRFKDDGGDCNNLFWNRETMVVKGDSLLFTTHYFQKTGMDPIPEWRKQVYVITTDGKMVLVSDRFKYYNSAEWVENE